MPENVLFVITTDGLENASHRYSGAEIRKMVAHEQQKYGWQFLFLGANIDAFAAAENIGIRREMTSNFMADSRGVNLGFESVDRAVSCARMSVPMAGDWKADVEADHARRSQK